MLKQTCDKKVAFSKNHGQSQDPISDQKGVTVALWLVHLTLERAVQVRALAGDIMLCSWARHLTLTVPLSTQWGSDL